ncbi:MAG: 1-acyl-sn-glycerol-3-phosphate acyltransferase [Nostocaceae cyanobacterium]|nr:1-acyl-sn-glycerol-3-phosphate acyltransferase [Nostocaceae cyanobacterium]
MPNLIDQAQRPLEFIPPALNPLVLQVARLLLPFWIRTKAGITGIEADNLEVLANLYHQFQEGKTRFMLAFRHPKVEDPLCLCYLLWYLLPKVAREQNITLHSPIHAHFIYDRGIPLWAGEYVGWIASRLGGTPINRGKADWTGIRSARDLFVNGKFPMVAAPEGFTNGHNEMISPLEPGIAQFGFWCAEDLQKAGRQQEVVILPVGIQYRYVTPPWQAIDKLLSELEAKSGLSVGGELRDPGETSLQEFLYRRLYRLGERFLSVMEDFYIRFYHRTVSQTSSQEKGEVSSENAVLKARLQELLDVALQVTEEYFNLLPKGTLTDRCRRLEQAGWNYIFREELKDEQALSTLERGLADRIAEEANMRMWHMRLVETFVAVSGEYVRENPTAERFGETSLLLWDMVTRIEGGNPFNRPRLGKQQVKITIGKPISVSERYPVYKGSRLGARQAVADLTKDLQQSLERMIVVGQ